MHRRPSVAVAPLPALALPAREMNALLSSGSAPHTPTKRAEPLPLFTVNKNRYSTDSWNSSNLDGSEDMELEWKPEHIRFLNRTLDSLPAHLLTPFIGSVLPSNLLDKIARRVSEAKGQDWPHSIRATRAKLIELGRVRARESRDGSGSGSDTIAEEGDGSDVPLQSTTNLAPKRPMRRQSSMDFIQPDKPSKDNVNITRLSRRLQKTDRLLTSPHKTHARSPSPVRRPLSLNPSTPSSSTLNSGLSSFRAGDRRSTSSMSSTASDQPILMAVRRIRRSDTFAGSCLPRGLKRAPSFGSSRNSLESVAMSIDFDAKASDATSSDEEEKMRSRKAKRVRRKISSPAPASPIAPLRTVPPVVAPTVRPKATGIPTVKRAKNATLSSVDRAPPSRPKATLQRNPSILGGELPAPQPNVEPPAVARASHRATLSHHDVYQTIDTPVHSPMAVSPYNLTHIPPATPQSTSAPRRTRRTAPLPRASLARKISFGNLASPQGESHGASGLGLESAFQMH